MPPGQEGTCPGGWKGYEVYYPAGGRLFGHTQGDAYGQRQEDNGKSCGDDGKNTGKGPVSQKFCGCAKVGGGPSRISGRQRLPHAACGG